MMVYSSKKLFNKKMFLFSMNDGKFFNCLYILRKFVIESKIRTEFTTSISCTRRCCTGPLFEKKDQRHCDLQEVKKFLPKTPF